MPTDTSTIVLVGHGMVGQRFLEALAERGLTATHRVVVLCEEPRPAYDRVQLTSYFSGRTPEDLSLTDLAFIEDHGIELNVGDPAEHVDREARTVTARSGMVVGYDVLVLATGSYPFVPPVPNKDAEGCFVYRTIEDLLAIEEYARGRAKTGAVVGGGLLGLEAAGALKGLGLTSHIVEFAPRLMPVQVDEGGGAALLRTIEDMGLSVHTGVGTQEIVVDEAGCRHRHEAVRRPWNSPPTWWCSPPVSDPATSSPATAAWRSASAAESPSTSSAVRSPTRTCSRSASAPSPPTAGCTAWSPPATSRPRRPPRPSPRTRPPSPAPTCPPS